MDMARGFPVLDAGTVAVSRGGIQQGNQARFDAVGLYLEDCQRDRQLETPRAGAAGVHVETVAAPFDAGLVGVAGDDEFDVRIEIGGDIGDVVNEEGWPTVEGEGQEVGEVFGPWAVEVVVAAHGVDRGDLGQLGEDVRVADVAGVDDLVTALERGEGFGAEEVVGVGDQGAFHGGLSVGGLGGSGWFRP